MIRHYYRPLVRPLPQGASLSTPARRLVKLLAALALLPWGWAYLLYCWWR